MVLLQQKHIHFVGIGGIGVSALAKICLAAGIHISGSDADKSLITDELASRGAVVFIGHDKRNIPKNTTLLLYSSAVPPSNPERESAARQHIPQLSYSEALGELSRERRTIAISGTHGKSTTTAMLGSILIFAGFDPLVVVGTQVNGFSDGNAHIGQGQWFVVEACEHAAQMMQISPERIVLTNLEPDHLDFYGTFDALKKQFKIYAQKVAADYCVVNADDDALMGLFTSANAKPITFGVNGTHYKIIRRVADENGQIVHIQTSSGEFEMCLSVYGAMNAMNALAALAAAESIGVERTVALVALGNYTGSWRRFERIGEYRGSPVISDYGHHPTAIRETLNAISEAYPDRRVVLVYQPHQHHRTKALRSDFVTELAKSDALVLHKIYDVTGREKCDDQDISARSLLYDIQSVDSKTKQPHAIRFATETYDEIKKIIAEHKLPDDIIVVMGAGDIYKLANELCLKS